MCINHGQTTFLVVAASGRLEAQLGWTADGVLQRAAVVRNTVMYVLHQEAAMITL